jgi:hypothetical protein
MEAGFLLASKSSPEMVTITNGVQAGLVLQMGTW